jgi:hypothetical protein
MKEASVQGPSALPPRRERVLGEGAVGQLMGPLSGVDAGGRSWSFDNLHRALNRVDSLWVAELRAAADEGGTWVSRRPGETPTGAVENAVQAALDGRVWQELDPDHYGPYKNEDGAVSTL